jgi:hypothetical protein
MKKLLIVFIILPFISIAQIRDCTIKSFATYHYDWCRGDINVYETNTNTTKFKIYKDYFVFVCYNNDDKIYNRRKIRWKHISTKHNKIHTYYAKNINFKYIINENERKIYKYYNYNKEMDSHVDVSVYLY